MGNEEHLPMYNEPEPQPRRTKVELKEYPHVSSTDRSDPLAWMNSKEQYNRERLIAQERMHTLRHQIIHCYQKEGVNHYQLCQHLTRRYMMLLRMHNNGMLQPPKKTDAEDDDDDE